MDVRMIAAVGLQGQLGLNGDMPWGRGHPEDLRRFRDLTTGGVMLAGYRTFVTMEHLNGTRDRTLLCDSDLPPAVFLSMVASVHVGRTIWIVGGAKTYARYAPFVTEFVIRQIDYEGPADVFLPNLWSPR